MFHSPSTVPVSSARGDMASPPTHPRPGLGGPPRRAPWSTTVGRHLRALVLAHPLTSVPVPSLEDDPNHVHTRTQRRDLCPGKNCTAEFTRLLAPFSRHRTSPQSASRREKTPAEQGFSGWAILDSNQRPLPCEDPFAPGNDFIRRVVEAAHRPLFPLFRRYFCSERERA